MKNINVKNVLAGLGVVFILLISVMVAFPAVASRVMKSVSTDPTQVPHIVEDDLDPF